MRRLRRVALFIRIGDVLIQRRRFRRLLILLLVLLIGCRAKHDAQEQQRRDSHFHCTLVGSGTAFPSTGQTKTSALSLPSIRARKVLPLRAFLSVIMSPCLPCASETAGMRNWAVPEMAVTSTKSPRWTWNGSIRSARNT